MKKILTILSVTLVITFFSLRVKAQDAYEQPKSYLTFLFGLSSPLGDFKSADYYNNKAGFGKNGTTLGFDGAIYVFKNLAIGYNLNYSYQGELSLNDDQILANGYNSDFNKNTTDVTSSGIYQSFNFMVGPQYTFRHDKFFLDLRASAGLLKSGSTPSLTIVFDEAQSAISTVTQLNSNATSFAYGASAALRWSFADSWDVSVKENFVNASGIKIEYDNDPGTTGRFVTKQPISMLQTTLGITVRF